MCFPTLLIAACDAVGLIAGPSRTFLLRNFSSEASPPGSAPSADGKLAGRVLARLQRGISHQHLATGTAPAFGRALAPCNGSDLLPLRLLSICSWVIPLYGTAPMRRFCELCQTRPLPAAPCPFRAPPLRAGPFGGVDPPEQRAASWSYSSNHNPLGNCIGARPETGLGPDSARTWFLGHASPHSSYVAILERLRRRPEELVIFACRRLAPRRGGRHQLTPAFPRLPGIIPVVLPAGFSCRRASTVLSRNGCNMRPARRKVTGLFLPSYSPPRAGSGFSTGE
ncbi:hypothetical protein Verru16b_02668 [Lacunisphaera limnophila]|uniref:Uncharacterized protein n=1 Tax=Lacunisphaera limnophila TaxID=1838286 RepID=A0A1D8AXG4_9BACT|nr:hypothetical protein Verru16b_02668 [Lacunisphaera limnophila]